MGTVRFFATLSCVCALSTAAALAAGAPAASAGLERCVAGGTACVERTVEVRGERVASVSTVAPARGVAPGVSRRPTRTRLIVEHARAGARIPARTTRELRVLPRNRVSIVELRPGVSIAEALDELLADPDVRSVEPDREVTIAATVPEDPLWIEQWGMRTIGAPDAWDHGTDGDGVIVAVLDTGIDLGHRDLGQSVWVAPDGTRGYNCVTGTGDPADVADDNGHGTHVAGIIGAAANADGDASNDHGVAGTMWRTRILPMKFLDRWGTGHVSDAIACFERIDELIDAGADIRVTNNSWGGYERTFALRRAMARLAWRGVVHVAAAGNDGRDADVFPVFPAAFRMPGLVSVGSTGISDVRSPFSNHGLASVDLAAPGEYIMSTVPSGICSGCDPSGYAYGSGTSAAAPHVAGVVAAIVQERPGWTARQVRDALLRPEHVGPITLPSTTDGRVDFAAVRAGVADTSSMSLNRPPRFQPYWFRPQRLAAGDAFAFEPTVSDQDGDAVTLAVRRPAVAELDTIPPLAWTIGQLMPQAVDGRIAFVAPPVASPITLSYTVSAADGRGGGVLRQQLVTLAAVEAGAAAAPIAELVLSDAQIEVGATVELSSGSSDPDGSFVWGYECNGSHGGFGEFDPSAGSYTRTIWVDGTFRCRAYVVDDTLNVAVSPSVLLEVGSDSRRPPEARLEVDATVGTRPLTVALDASGSSDADGSVTSYAFSCGEGGVTPATDQPTASCTFRRPGPHVVRVTVVDDELRTDSIAVPVMVVLPGT